MGVLIKLTVSKRNNTVKNDIEMLFDVDSIVSPIRFNSGSKSYFTIKTKSSINSGERIDYQVNETLEEIILLSKNFILLTVNSRHGKVIPSEAFIFNTSSINEVFSIDTGSGFSNVEYGDPLPVDYIVDEDIDSILSQNSIFTFLTDEGQFNTADADNAISIVVDGETKYIQLLTYTPPG